MGTFVERFQDVSSRAVSGYHRSSRLNRAEKKKRIFTLARARVEPTCKEAAHADTFSHVGSCRYLPTSAD